MCFQDGGDTGHVMLWDTFGNRNDQRNFCGHGLESVLMFLIKGYIENRLGGQRRRNKDGARISYNKLEIV